MNVEKCFDYMQLIRDEIAKGAQENQAHGSVMHSARLSLDFLDTASMWLGRMQAMINMTGEAAAEAAVAKAQKEGTIKTVGDDPNAPAPVLSFTK